MYPLRNIEMNKDQSFSGHWTATSLHGKGKNEVRAVELSAVRGEQVSIIDADLDNDKVLLLAESEPGEWTTEKPFVKVLALGLNGEAQQVTVLHGKGLNDNHGSGLCYEHPTRLLLAGAEHFLLVSERSIGALKAGSTTRAPVPFQIAVFHYSPGNGNLVHLLEEPAKAGMEYDLSINSVQCYGMHVVAVLRWRENEGIRQILRGGAVGFMDGWIEATAVVWDWKNGEIVAQLPLDAAGAQRPSVKLISDYELKINCSNSAHTAYIAAFDGQVHHHHSGDVSLNAIDRALQVAVSGTQDIPQHHLSDFPVFTARAVRLVHPAVLNGDSLGDATAAISLQRLHTLNHHTAIYGASLASDKSIRRLSRSNSTNKRFFLLSFDESKLAALEDDADAEQYLYSLPTTHLEFGNWPSELMATPQPFLRTLDDSLNRLHEEKPFTRPANSRSRSTSTAHSRHSSISSLWSEGYSGSEATGVQTPLTPVSDTGEDSEKGLRIAFIPLDDDKMVEILQGKCWASEGHIVGCSNGALRIMQL